MDIFIYIYIHKCSFDARKQYWVIFLFNTGDNTSIFIHFQSNLLDSTMGIHMNQSV